METERFSGPVIVAMKGPPSSGRSTLAWLLATTFKNYLLIAQDDCIIQLEEALAPSKNIERLNRLSFDIVRQIALTQLRLGHKVIIDGSLFLGSHLESLVQLSESIGARLVVVECKPQDKLVWQQRHLQRVEDDGKVWYKPSTWEELEAVLGLESYDDWSDHDVVPDFSKLVVDTTRHNSDWDITSGVKYLASCAGTQRMDLHQWATEIWQNVDADLWKQSKGDGDEDDGEGEGDDDENSHHHHQLLLVNKRLKIDNGGGDPDDEELGRSICRGCLEPISSPCYYRCGGRGSGGGGGCDLSAHKECAELSNKKEFSFELGNCPDGYCFTEKHRCRNCENKGDDEGIDECPECLFETNLRCAMLPSVILHNCHEHPLCIKTSPVSLDYGFKCKACGDLGKVVSYICECGFAIHPGCALMPRTIKHKTHRHTLSLTSLVQEDDSEDFNCDACEETRNPNHWVYYCEKCEFSCHLNCLTSGA
ncbi:hypothetical protein U1Q18_016641 [Sarracenia purpurea var. burkii]